MTGMCYVTPHDRGTFLVTSNSREGITHLVDLIGEDDRPECSCEVFDFVAPGNRKKGLPPPVCRHIQEVLVYLEIPGWNLHECHSPTNDFVPIVDANDDQPTPKASRMEASFR